MFDPCEEKLPRVIDDAFLKKCLYDQAPPGEIGRLRRFEGLSFDDALEIRLEFMNIIRIDHLWVLKNLRKLQLSNNYIERIENLGSLIHLTELDLSFNKISYIENLDALVNIEKLSLYSNYIPRIENMDTLKKLKIFSIGKNMIEDKYNVIYLRRFDHLRALNMAENPCSMDPSFRMFVATFMPDLVYYEYKLIAKSEREAGMKEYEEEYYSIENKVAVETSRRLALEKEEADALLHADSFVEYLNTRRLFDQLFVIDEEGKVLLQMGEEMDNLYTDLEEGILEQCRSIFILGQEQYEIRKAEVELYFGTVGEAKRKSQEQSIAIMETFVQKKDQIFADLTTFQEETDRLTQDPNDFNAAITRFTDTFNALLHSTWKELMKYEMLLYEQMVEVNETFEHSITDMINTFIESSQGLFTHMRVYEVDFSEGANDLANRISTVLSTEPDLEMPEDLKDVLLDKENITNYIGASHDIHLQIIDQREDQLVNNARTWLNNLINGINNGELERNRAKILEINHFLDVQREEFEEINSRFYNALDMDITE